MSGIILIIKIANAKLMSNCTQITRLLIVSHQPSPNTKTLADAVQRGARSQAEEQVELIQKTPFDTSAQDVLSANGLIIGTTENFGYMAGATKDFFDRCYYDLLERTDALPYAVYIRAGLDGTGAKRAITGICSALNWKEVQESLVCKGAYQTKFEEDCEQLGAAMMAGLSVGIF